MDDIKQKLNDALNANPELVEKVKSAPAEAAEAIKKATGLNLDASDVDKVKEAYREFTGDDGLDFGDFQRAAAALFAKGKEAASNIDVDSIKETAGNVAAKGAAVASDLVEKGTEVAGDLIEKGTEVAGDLIEKGKEFVEDAKAKVDTPQNTDSQNEER